MRTNQTVWVLALLLSAAGLCAAQTCVEAPPGLISWWTGDGTTDDLLGANNGTPEGGVSFAPGFVGDAFLLDGVDDAVALPDLDAQLPDFGYTYSAWVRVDTLPPPTTQGGILGSWTRGWDDLTVWHGVAGAALHYSLYDYDSTHACSLHLQDPSMRFADRIGEWVFVAITHDGSKITIYMDDKTESIPCNLKSSRRLRYIGRANNPTSNFIGGAIDEVAIYNRSLSAAELNAIYLAGPAGVCKAGAIKKLAQEKAAAIVTQIMNLNLQQGITNSLDAKLSSAFAALDDMNGNNDIAAINSLYAAINAIEAQRDKKIPSAEADALIAAIQEVIDLLNSAI